jgi:hypothetical protein
MSEAPRDNFGAMVKRHWGCLPVLVAVVATIISSLLMFQLTQYLYISAAYGREAWQGGLRVVDKKGNLSDGRRLSRAGHVAVYGGGCLLMVPVFLGCGLGLPFLGMKLRRERLGEQLARWKAEHQEEGPTGPGGAR